MKVAGDTGEIQYNRRMSPACILVADGEPKMISLLRQVFAGEGYRLIAAAKGEQAVLMAAQEQPALILLGVQLAGGPDGFEALRRIREFSDAPVILLSTSDLVEDALRGFDLGADDYVVKPLNPRLLLARARVLLRRCPPGAGAPAEIVCSDLVIDLASHRVTRAGDEVYLTDTEYQLLLELARHRDRVLMHEQLLVAVWGNAYRSEVGYLRSYVHILRRKLEHDPSQPRLILSRPGIGYMLATAQTSASGE